MPITSLTVIPGRIIVTFSVLLTKRTISGYSFAGIAKDCFYIPIDKPPHYVKQYGRIFAAGEGNVRDFTRTGKEGFYRPYRVVYLLV